MIANVSNSSGDALFTREDGLDHGLSDGDYVYVRGVAESYNGFWCVDSQSATTFKIKKNASADFVPFVKGIRLEYFTTDAQIDYSAVHLPITYEIESDLFPTNNVDTARTVSSFTNDNGLVNLNLSGSLGTFNDLDFVKISGAASAEVNGIFQVLERVSSSDITINLAYNSQYSFASGSVILYYSNYHIIVQVYAGINDTHALASSKPYELAATLRFIPDSNNKVKFSINDILKGYILNKNNLTLDTLPNNIDAWVNFYISHAESYDQSNGYTITNVTTAYTQDGFNGVAVNAMLPFKNIYSGYLSDYVMKQGILGRFLTLFAIPVIFSCNGETEECYQDIIAIIEIKNQLQLPELVEFSNAAGSNTVWSLGFNPTVTLSSSTSSRGLESDVAGFTSDIYDITISVIVDQPTSSYQMSISFRESGGPSTGVSFTAPALVPGLNVLSFSGLDLTSQIVDQIRFTATNNEASDRTFTLVGYSVSVQNNSQSLYLRKIYFNDNVEQDTIDILIDNQDEGVYRLPIADGNLCGYDQIKAYVFYTDGFYQEENIISEIKTFDIDCGCADFEIRLCWQNNLGGFDYWMFTEASDFITDIGETGEQRTNILPAWPNSYGEFADTRNRQTFRESRRQMRIRSQYVSRENLEALSYIKKSILVQVINSRLDRRTVLVDTDSFTQYREDDKQFSIEFTITFTDDNPVQRV